LKSLVEKLAYLADDGIMEEDATLYNSDKKKTGTKIIGFRDNPEKLQ